MKLSSQARRGPGAKSLRLAATTTPGFLNPNRQSVVARTGAPSAVRPSQVVYKLRCGACTHEYGCNGLDIKARLCPACQGGVTGETLREPAPSLFS